MATEDHVTRLRLAVDHLKSMGNYGALYRQHLGASSLSKGPLPDLLSRLVSKGEFAIINGPGTWDGAVSAAMTLYERISERLEDQSKLSDGEYVSKASDFVKAVEDDMEALNCQWPHFVTASIESSRLLELAGAEGGLGETIKRANETMKDLDTHSSQLLESLDEYKQTTLHEIETDAEARLARVRQTAQKVSIDAAQTEFGNAQKRLAKLVRAWGILSFLFVVVFVLLAVHYAQVQPAADQIGWHIVYFTAIRITILTAAGAAITFCLRVLRSQIHLLEANAHRKILVNSIPAFVEAVSPEQRDLVLTKLLEGVVTFGHSGLISSDGDTVYVPQMPLEAVLKQISKN